MGNIFLIALKKDNAQQVSHCTHRSCQAGKLSSIGKAFADVFFLLLLLPKSFNMAVMHSLK